MSRSELEAVEDKV